MNDPNTLIDLLRTRLTAFYEQIKTENEPDQSAANFINGIMASIRHLDLLSKDELKELINATHLEILGVSYEERKIDEALNKGGKHWEFFDVPTATRKR